MCFFAKIFNSTNDDADWSRKFEIRVTQVYEPCNPDLASAFISLNDLINLKLAVNQAHFDWNSLKEDVNISGGESLIFTFKNNQYIDIVVELSENESSKFRDEVRQFVG